MDCPDNCCDSYFLHHTYTEWAYLWEGLNRLASDQLQKIEARAREYVAQSESILAEDEHPIIMCPVNEAGLCTVYPYRMMICRLHGVPSTFRRPDGQRMDFPGCFRCQEISKGITSVEPLDRTEFFQRLVGLELELLGEQRRGFPKVKLSLAQMIVQGPPGFPI
jgi:hypothetical protein